MTQYESNAIYEIVSSCCNPFPERKWSRNCICDVLIVINDNFFALFSSHAGYPDDPSMHGLIAGLWSSLSGLGRFVSRAGSGILVDHIGFQKTAAVAVTLQLIVAVVTFVYMLFYEILLKKTDTNVHWDDVTFIEEGSRDEVTSHVTSTADTCEIAPLSGISSQECSIRSWVALIILILIHVCQARTKLSFPPGLSAFVLI